MNNETVLPKNVRQIGEIQQDRKIYIEDFVMTYLHKKEEEPAEEGKSGILLGRKEEKEEGLTLFIKGAVLMETAEEEIQQYFPDLDVVGFFVLGIPEEQALQKLIDGEKKQKNLLIYHFQEEEENLYWAEESQYQRIQGYFIFYERNPEMQKYMMKCNAGVSVEKEEENADEAIVSFRSKIAEKMSGKKRGTLRYLASSFLLLTVLMLGVTIIHNYDKMKEIETVIQQLSAEPETGYLTAAEVLSKAVSDEPESQPGTDTGNQTENGSEESAEKENVSIQEEKSGEEKENRQTAGETSGAEELTESAEANAVLSAEVSDSVGLQSDLSAAEVSGSVDLQNDYLAQRNYSAENLADAAFGKTDEITAAAGRSQQAAYTIKYGDTLADISVKYYGTLEKVQDICEINGIKDANLIIPGEKIVLP